MIVATVARIRVPTPGVLCITLTSPPSSSANRRLMVNPRPEPTCRPLADASACVKGWNNCVSCSREMPIPESTISNCIVEEAPLPTCLISNRTQPWSVNLIALATRLISICRRRVLSVKMFSGIGLVHSMGASRLSPQLALAAMQPRPALSARASNASSPLPSCLPRFWTDRVCR